MLTLTPAMAHLRWHTSNRLSDVRAIHKLATFTCHLWNKALKRATEVAAKHVPTSSGRGVQMLPRLVMRDADRNFAS